MARKLRSPPVVEPAIFDRRDAAWRYRLLTRWLMVTDLGLSQEQLESLPAWDADGSPTVLRKLESQIDGFGLRAEADAFIQHLLDARSRWPLTRLRPGVP